MTITEDLALTAEICGTDLSERAAKVIVAELKVYEAKAVHGALARCRRECHGKLTLASVLERLDDGRPSPEAAWALLPKDEAATEVITDDMRLSMGPALSLLNHGNMVQARLAFVEAYRATVANARAKGVPVSWFATLGHDRKGRQGPLMDAVRDGRLELGHAITLGLEDQRAKQDAIEDLRELLSLAGPKEIPPKETP